MSVSGKVGSSIGTPATPQVQPERQIRLKSHGEVSLRNFSDHISRVLSRLTGDQTKGELIRTLEEKGYYGRYIINSLFPEGNDSTLISASSFQEISPVQVHAILKECYDLVAQGRSPELTRGGGLPKAALPSTGLKPKRPEMENCDLTVRTKLACNVRYAFTGKGMSFDLRDPNSDPRFHTKK
jgi:hypothetical protein